MYYLLQLEYSFEITGLRHFVTKMKTKLIGIYENSTVLKSYKPQTRPNAINAWVNNDLLSNYYYYQN